MSWAAILDFLRTNFALFIAVAFPVAGVVLAIIKYAEGDREDAFRIAAASLLGCFLYALLLT